MTSSRGTIPGTGTKRTEEKHEKHEKFVGGGDFIFLLQKNKGEEGLKWYGKMRKVVEMGTVEVESVNNKKIRR